MIFNPLISKQKRLQFSRTSRNFIRAETAYFLVYLEYYAKKFVISSLPRNTLGVICLCGFLLFELKGLHGLKQFIFAIGHFCLFLIWFGSIVNSWIIDVVKDDNERHDDRLNTLRFQLLLLNFYKKGASKANQKKIKNLFVKKFNDDYEILFDEAGVQAFTDIIFYLKLNQRKENRKINKTFMNKILILNDERLLSAYCRRRSIK